MIDFNFNCIAETKRDPKPHRSTNVKGLIRQNKLNEVNCLRVILSHSSRNRVQVIIEIQKCLHKDSFCRYLGGRARAFCKPLLQECHSSTFLRAHHISDIISFLWILIQVKNITSIFKLFHRGLSTLLKRTLLKQIRSPMLKFVWASQPGSLHS